MNTDFGTKSLFAIVSLFLISACDPISGAPLSYSMTGGLQIYPNSTTVGINQGMTFQVSGGTAPYQYQISGDGTIDTNGDFQAGPYAGQAQVQVSDAYGNTGSAMVSVVQTSTNYNPYSQSDFVASARPQGPGWSASTVSELKQAPFVRGQVVGVGDRQLDAQGDSVHSKFLKTNLNHPVVRMDELIEGKSIVAVRAVVEDQFLVKLQPGYSEADLSAIVNNAGARISKHLETPGTYLVSMNKHGEMNGSGISANFLASRTRLKQELQSIGAVAPNALSRAPSGK